MPDRETIESVAGKFQSWAESLSPAEQWVLASWLKDDEDVTAHSPDTWWQEPLAWEEEWKKRGAW